MNLPVPHALKRRPRILNVLHAAGLIEPLSHTIEREFASLERHARGRRLGVEIGTAMGVSAVRIARVMVPDGRLYCVDPYPGENNPMWNVCKRGLSRAGVQDKITFLRGFSAEVAAQIPDGCDFFFVDGDHSYEGLAIDWQIVKDRLAPGGIACFHDTTVPAEEPDRTHGSVKYYQEVIAHDPQFTHLETSYSLNVIQRRSAP